MATEKRFVKWLYGFLLIITMAFMVGADYQQRKLQMVTVSHTVHRNETLWEIGERYITPGRYMPEFIEGIYELNYDRVFAERERHGAPRKSVYPGDVLEIHYWR